MQFRGFILNAFKNAFVYFGAVIDNRTMAIDNTKEDGYNVSGRD